VKICLCGNRFPPNVVGGAEVMVHDLAVQLRDRGHDVYILTLSDTRSGSRSVVDGLDVRIMPNMNVYNQFVQDDRGALKKALFALIDTFNPVVFFLAWRQLKSLGVDVLCTNTLKGMGPAVWLAARALGVPIVHVMHDYWLACPNIVRFKNGRACEGSCNSCRKASTPKAWLSRLVGHAVAVSKFVLERHRDQHFFPRAEQSVIYNAPPPMAAMPFQRTQPAKPHTPFRVGFIGRTDATKGIREFFESVAAAARITTAIEVHIAGRDIDNVVPGLIDAHPQLKVVYHGFMSAAAFYETVDVIAVTSMWDEPFGMVAIEPWELYKPSVAFASGGLGEVFAALPDLSVPRGDCTALGTLIARLASDEAFYVDAARRCHAERVNFMPTKQVDQFERVLLAATTRADGFMNASPPGQADRDA
jgi:glycogen(starch) synthase